MSDPTSPITILALTAIAWAGAAPPDPPPDLLAKRVWVLGIAANGRPYFTWAEASDRYFLTSDRFDPACRKSITVRNRSAAPVKVQAFMESDAVLAIPARTVSLDPGAAASLDLGSTARTPTCALNLKFFAPQFLDKLLRTQLNARGDVTITRADANTIALALGYRPLRIANRTAETLRVSMYAGTDDLQAVALRSWMVRPQQVLTVTDAPSSFWLAVFKPQVLDDKLTHWRFRPQESVTITHGRFAPWQAHDSSVYVVADSRSEAVSRIALALRDEDALEWDPQGRLALLLPDRREARSRFECSRADEGKPVVHWIQELIRAGHEFVYGCWPLRFMSRTALDRDLTRGTPSVMAGYRYRVLEGRWEGFVLVRDTAGRLTDIDSTTGATRAILGTGLRSGPVVITQDGDPRTVLIFARFADNSIRYRTWARGQWAAWMTLGGDTRGRPAVTWNAIQQRIDVFAKGADGRLWQRTSFRGTWNDWSRVSPVVLSGSPAAASWDERGQTHIYLFARLADQGSDGYHYLHSDGRTFGSWISMGGPAFRSSPVASP